MIDKMSYGRVWIKYNEEEKRFKVRHTTSTFYKKPKIKIGPQDIEVTLYIDMEGKNFVENSFRLSVNGQLQYELPHIAADKNSVNIKFENLLVGLDRLDRFDSIEISWAEVHRYSVFKPEINRIDAKILGTLEKYAKQEVVKKAEIIPSASIGFNAVETALLRIHCLYQDPGKVILITNNKELPESSSKFKRIKSEFSRKIQESYIQELCEITLDDVTYPIYYIDQPPPLRDSKYLRAIAEYGDESVFVYGLK